MAMHPQLEAYLASLQHKKDHHGGYPYNFAYDYEELAPSRNGHAALYLWYAITKRKNAFAGEVKNSRKNAEYLRDKLVAAQLNATLTPFSTTVVLPKPAAPVVKKWQLATWGDRAHFIVMQNHTPAVIDEFVADIRK
jgi:histidine decarboxylase